MHIVLYEDDGWKNLRPLTLTRPVWELRCGITTLVEKIQSIIPGSKISFICRDYLAPLVSSKYPESRVNEFKHSDTLFLNGRVIWDKREFFEGFIGNSLIYRGGKFAGGFVKGALAVEGADWQAGKTMDTLNELLVFKERMCGLFRRDIEAEIIEYPWDMVELTPGQIFRDLKNMGGLREIKAQKYKNQGVHVVSGHGVFTDGKVSLAPGVVLDSSEGPIFLGDGVKIMPNAVIQGPASIGAGSLVKIGAKIYAGTSAGPVCKLGGEIGETVIQGYSNKQHEGFLGHAALGEWCNIGAGTENSDLKNNYTPVKVQIGKKRVNSGKIFVGLFMGDHSKTGINTTFNTGTVAGVGSMAFGAGFQPRYIPSFKWSDGSKLIPADFDSTLKTAKTVMVRRDIEMTDEEVSVLRRVYDDSMSGD
ncbi:MAG: hypothetical protein H8E46_02255 [FCB group bacterium]|nr:hypothetical protein [FCB group bacterium]